MVQSMWGKNPSVTNPIFWRFDSMGQWSLVPWSSVAFCISFIFVKNESICRFDLFEEWVVVRTKRRSFPSIHFLSRRPLLLELYILLEKISNRSDCEFVLARPGITMILICFASPCTSTMTVFSKSIYILVAFRCLPIAIIILLHYDWCLFDKMM